MTRPADSIPRKSYSQLFDLQTLALTCLTRLVPFAVGAFASAGAIESAIAAAAPDNEAPSDGHDPRRAAALAFLERACVFGDGLNLAERVGGSQLAMDAALWQLDPERTSGGSSSGRDGSYVSGHGDTLGDTLNASARQLHGFAQQSDHDASFVSTGEVEHFAYGAVTVAPGTSLFGTYGTKTFSDTGRHDNYGVPGVDTRNSVPGVSTRHGNSTGRDGAPIVRPRVADDPAALAACALLSALCDGDARNFRRLRRAGGVATLLGAVRALADTDAAVPIAFGAATIRAVWRCVVPDHEAHCATFASGRRRRRFAFRRRTVPPRAAAGTSKHSGGCFREPEDALFFPRLALLVRATLCACTYWRASHDVGAELVAMRG